MSSSDVSNAKGPTVEEQEAVRNAQACIDECHIEQLVHDTKFLRVDSLLELVKALIFSSSQPIEQDASSAAHTHQMHHSGSAAATHNQHHHQLITSTSLTNLNLVSIESKVDYDAAVFSLECLVKVRRFFSFRFRLDGISSNELSRVSCILTPS